MFVMAWQRPQFYDAIEFYVLFLGCLLAPALPFASTLNHFREELARKYNIIDEAPCAAWLCMLCGCHCLPLMQELSITMRLKTVNRPSFSVVGDAVAMSKLMPVVSKDAQNAGAFGNSSSDASDRV